MDPCLRHAGTGGDSGSGRRRKWGVFSGSLLTTCRDSGLKKHIFLENETANWYYMYYYNFVRRRKGGKKRGPIGSVPYNSTKR